MSVDERVGEDGLVQRAPAGRLAHLPALDGLRGVAVAAVLVFHAGHLTGGYLGVDLFFVLSGYLITTLLVVEWAATDRIALGAFWSRRARRLLPALLAVLVAVGVASHFFVPPVSRGQLRGEGLATLGYVANWFAIFRGNGYWEHSLLPSWLQHTWSLAIEEQFYVLWPLVVVVTLGRAHTAEPASDDAPGSSARRRVRRLAVVAWGGAALSAGLMVGLAIAGASTQRLYLGTDTRIAAIMLGAGLACRNWLADERRSATATATKAGRRAVALLGFAGAAVLLAAWTTLDGTSDALYRGGLLVCGLAATAVLLDITTPGSSPLQRVLGVAPLRWLGLISYGLYLWHWPIYQYLSPGRFALNGRLLVTVRISASLAVAAASYRLIEQPVRRGALRGSVARLALVSAAAVTSGALLLGTTGAVDPMPDAAGTQVSGAYTPAPASTTAPVPKVLAVGDSVALSLTVDGIAPQAQQLGVQVANQAVIGCTIMRDGPDPRASFIHNCSPAWAGLIERYRPDVVMVLFGGWPGLVPFTIGDGHYLACDGPWQRRWRQRLEAAVDVLSARGARVVLVSAPTAGNPLFQGGDPELFNRQQECSNRVLAEVGGSRREAAFVDLARFVCPEATSCKTTIDGDVVRPDYQHFRGPGALLVGRWVVPQVLAAARRPVG